MGDPRDHRVRSASDSGAPREYTQTGLRRTASRQPLGGDACGGTQTRRSGDIDARSLTMAACARAEAVVEEPPQIDIANAPLRGQSGSIVRTARLLSVAIALAIWALAPVQSALACSGQDATLAAGFRGATSVYFARIVGLRPTTTGFYGLTLDIGQVLHGTAQTHVTHVIDAQVCAALELGDSGVVALGSVNPFGVGPTDLYNFFFVLGPGHHISRSDVFAALSSAPQTDTASDDARANLADSAPAFWLVGLTSGIVMLILQHSHRERLRVRKAPSRTD